MLSRVFSYLDLSVSMLYLPQALEVRLYVHNAGIIFLVLQVARFVGTRGEAYRSNRMFH